MATIVQNENGMVVESQDSRGFWYYYLADGLGTPTEGGWRRKGNAIAALDGDGPEPEFAIDDRGRMGLMARAAQLGSDARRDYEDEFGARPAPGREGDWDVTAWTEAWTELEHDRAGKADHEACLAAWRDGFYG